MDPTGFRSDRRGFLGSLALGATAFTAGGAFAEEMTAGVPIEAKQENIR